MSLMQQIVWIKTVGNPKYCNINISKSLIIFHYKSTFSNTVKQASRFGIVLILFHLKFAWYIQTNPKILYSFEYTPAG